MLNLILMQSFWLSGLQAFHWLWPLQEHFLHQTHLTFERYLQEYEKRWDIDPQRPVKLQEYQDRTLYTTWDLSYTRLESDDPDAANLLKVLAYFQFREDDKCTCGAKETVVHVLVDCPKLKSLRQELRRKVGTDFNSISCMLGGQGQTGKEGKLSQSAQDSTVSAVLDFAEASQRFQSRAPKGPRNTNRGT